MLQLLLGPVQQKSIEYSCVPSIPTVMTRTQNDTGFLADK